VAEAGAGGRSHLDGPGAGEPDEAAAVIREYGPRWMIVGPCLDGGWYAWPRGDDTARRTLASSLADLGLKLKERECAPH
jgi:hypothetical protein